MFFYTTRLLIGVLDFIHRRPDKRDTSLALALSDFKKAFNLLDHTVAITMAIKILSNLVAWLTGFFSGCQQVVC